MIVVLFRRICRKLNEVSLLSHQNKHRQQCYLRDNGILILDALTWFFICWTTAIYFTAIYSIGLKHAPCAVHTHTHIVTSVRCKQYDKRNLHNSLQRVDHLNFVDGRYHMGFSFFATSNFVFYSSSFQFGKNGIRVRRNWC